MTLDEKIEAHGITRKRDKKTGRHIEDLNTAFMRLAEKTGIEYNRKQGFQSYLDLVEKTEKEKAAKESASNKEAEKHAAKLKEEGHTKKGL